VSGAGHDGHLDVAMTSVGRRAVLLKNQGARGGHWIQIRAEGTTSNKFGLGATVRVRTAGRLQVREINNAASYLSSSDTRLHVGLGSDKIIQELEILWPSGRRQMLKEVAVDQILTVKEP